MSKDKYKHAMEILRAASEGKPLQWSDGGEVWCDNPHFGSIEIDQLNDPDTIRIKPTPSAVPFGPEDITSDMWFKHNSSDDCWNKPVSISGKCVSFSDSPHWTYEQLQDSFVYRKDGWVEKTAKCEKCNTFPPPPKREPRRVWKNLYRNEEGKLVWGLITFDSKEKALENGLGDDRIESAVEFVEVVK